MIADVSGDKVTVQAPSELSDEELTRLAAAVVIYCIARGADLWDIAELIRRADESEELVECPPPFVVTNSE